MNTPKDKDSTQGHDEHELLEAFNAEEVVEEPGEPPHLEPGESPADESEFPPEG